MLPRVHRRAGVLLAYMLSVEPTERQRSPGDTSMISCCVGRPGMRHHGGMGMGGGGGMGGAPSEMFFCKLGPLSPAHNDYPANNAAVAFH